MKGFPLTRWSQNVTFCLMCVIVLCGCHKKVNDSVEEVNTDSTSVSDTLATDTAEYSEGSGGRGLNDIRFDGWTDIDWVDNEYIRSLRRYIDDYNNGRIQNEALDEYRDKMKGKFVIGWSEPFFMGGLFLHIIFLDSPSDIFLAWVYSSVDEETETVLDYEVRRITHDETKNTLSREEILKLMEEHPEYKLW